MTSEFEQVKLIITKFDEIITLKASKQQLKDLNESILLQINLCLKQTQFETIHSDYQAEVDK